MRDRARFIVLSVPTRRYDHVAHMVRAYYSVSDPTPSPRRAVMDGAAPPTSIYIPQVPELLSLGGALADALSDSPKRSLLLISADLAHTHLSSGPYGRAANYPPCDA